MDWWLIIVGVIAAALAYGYWDHTRQSRRLTGIFAVLAARHGGQVKRASLLVLPQLRFESDGRRVLVTAMATSGATAKDSAPFTFVDVELPFDTGAELRVERSADPVERLIDTVTPGRPPATGHEAFDQAFRIKGKDRAFAARLLDARVRYELLGSQLPRLACRVDGRKISVDMDGTATAQSEIEELIKIAALLAERCAPGPRGS
ncbi:MAG: hypothetical protein OEM93_14385 [Rhodospirillales bacterium]|nr:hypothetical protein [Rhodospirillales bacterium]MDH3920915.1 hypothetical protein [Rhodospirillales bacterium]MDH3968276.1 hypothetical protein [Rhodospirillales bacterium]